MKEEEPLVTMKTGAEIVRDCGTEILRLEIEQKTIRREANERLRQIDLKIEKLRKTIEEAREMEKPFARLLKEAGNE